MLSSTGTDLLQLCLDIVWKGRGRERGWGLRQVALGANEAAADGKILRLLRKMGAARCMSTLPPLPPLSSSLRRRDAAGVSLTRTSTSSAILKAVASSCSDCVCACLLSVKRLSSCV